MSGKDGTPKALNNKDWRVREAVAGNSNTPTEALEKLAGDEDRDVCRAVAVNPNTPEHVKVFLALISTR